MGLLPARRVAQGVVSMQLSGHHDLLRPLEAVRAPKGLLDRRDWLEQWSRLSCVGLS